MQELVKPSLTDEDTFTLADKKQRFSEIWKVIERIGIDTVRFELKQQMFEVEPSNEPTHWKQVIPDLVVKGRRIPNV